MTRCKLHGGASLVGPANPHFRHGGESRFVGLPDKIRERAEQLFEDPNLISLRDRIAVNDARERELWETLDNGTSVEYWARTRDALKDIRQARAERDAHRLAEALGRLDTVADQARRQERVWKQIREVQEHGRKLRREERRLMETVRHYVRADEAEVFAIQIIQLAIDSIRQVATVGEEQAISDLLKRGRALRESSGG